MKVKMKRCLYCKTLLGNSSKVCSKCGSKDLEKGIYTDESNISVIYNKHLPKNEIRRCPCCGGEGIITIKNGIEVCSVCSIM
jgi:RNA polymerase subunit RPABC4/transcription elongation factor Spt4